MNLRNQADQAMDKALERYLEDIFMEFFKDGDTEELSRKLHRVEGVYKKIDKMLAEL